MSIAPIEITLPSVTIEVLQQDPELMAEFGQVAEAGPEAMIEWLDAYGLPWHINGYDPWRVLADGLATSAGEFGGFERERQVAQGGCEHRDRARKARHKAQRLPRPRNR
jgi:hypothetical protein